MGENKDIKKSHTQNKKVNFTVGAIVILLVIVVAIIVGSKIKYDVELATLTEEIGVTDLRNRTISDKELELGLDMNVPSTIYFHRFECPGCITAEPKILAYAKKHNIMILAFDTRGSGDHSPYNLEIVPTVIHFENGIEHSRIENDKSARQFDKFFKNIPDPDGMYKRDKGDTDD